MHIIICDDNPSIVEQIRSYISEFFVAENLPLPEYSCFENGDSLISQNLRADIAFLDVEMPGENGILVGTHLKALNPHILIFIVTAFPDYLDEAMRFHVFRYLSKPIDKARLFRNLKDAMCQFTANNLSYPVETPTGIHTFRADEIICIEAIQRKVLVHTTAGIFESKKTMHFWSHELSSPCFFVTHRAYIVNMRFLRSIEKDRVILQHLSIRKEAFLAKRRYPQLRNSYLLFLEGM